MILRRIRFFCATGIQRNSPALLADSSGNISHFLKHYFSFLTSPFLSIKQPSSGEGKDFLSSPTTPLQLFLSKGWVRPTFLFWTSSVQPLFAVYPDSHVLVHVVRNDSRTQSLLGTVCIFACLGKLNWVSQSKSAISKNGVAIITTRRSEAPIGVNRFRSGFHNRVLRSKENPKGTRGRSPGWNLYQACFRSQTIHLQDFGVSDGAILRWISLLLASVADCGRLLRGHLQNSVSSGGD